MERYLGMDVHAASCTICVVNSRGKKVRQDVVETHGEALVGYLKQQPGRLHLCFEEGEWAPWLHEILSPHVEELVVLHGEGHTGPKNDALDALNLAERLRTGKYTPIFKAPRSFAKLRELASVYALLTQDLVRAKNRLKSRYRRRGIVCTGDAVYRPESRADHLLKLPAAMHPAVKFLGCDLDQVQALRNEAQQAMVREAQRFKVARLLQGIPGLGPIRVAQLLPIVVTPHRFRTKRQFWAYCGLAIVTRSSADWSQHQGRWVKASRAHTRGLNRNSNRTLKALFKGAATAAIVGKNRFREAYDRLCAQGTKPNLAKVTVARKVAATTLAIWKSQEAYTA